MPRPVAVKRPQRWPPEQLREAVEDHRPPCGLRRRRRLPYSWAHRDGRAELSPSWRLDAPSVSPLIVLMGDRPMPLGGPLGPSPATPPTAPSWPSRAPAAATRARARPAPASWSRPLDSPTPTPGAATGCCACARRSRRGPGGAGPSGSLRARPAARARVPDSRRRCPRRPLTQRLPGPDPPGRRRNGQGRSRATGSTPSSVSMACSHSRRTDRDTP